MYDVTTSTIIGMESLLRKKNSGIPCYFEGRSAIFASKCRIRSKVTRRTDAYIKGIMGRESASH